MFPHILGKANKQIKCSMTLHVWSTDRGLNLRIRNDTGCWSWTSLYHSEPIKPMWIKLSWVVKFHSEVRDVAEIFCSIKDPLKPALLRLKPSDKELWSTELWLSVLGFDLVLGASWLIKHWCVGSHSWQHIQPDSLKRATKPDQASGLTALCCPQAASASHLFCANSPLQHEGLSNEPLNPEQSKLPVLTTQAWVSLEETFCSPSHIHIHAQTYIHTCLDINTCKYWFTINWLALLSH